MENDGGQATRSRGGEKEVREINEVQKLKVESSKNRDFEREQIRMAVCDIILIKMRIERTRREDKRGERFRKDGRRGAKKSKGLGWTGAEEDTFVKRAAVTNWRSFKVTRRATIKARLDEHDWTGLITARAGASPVGRRHQTSISWARCVLIAFTCLKPRDCRPPDLRRLSRICRFGAFSLSLSLSTCRFLKEINNMRSPAELKPAQTFQISGNKPSDGLTVSSANINYKSRSVWQDNLQKRDTGASIMHTGVKWNIKPAGSSGRGRGYLQPSTTCRVKVSFADMRPSTSQPFDTCRFVTPVGGCWRDSPGFCEALLPLDSALAPGEKVNVSSATRALVIVPVTEPIQLLCCREGSRDRWACIHYPIFPGDAGLK